ncbi:hypothetical protein Pla22_22660 [Rubripirellula amarantea]|uniref:Planctomycete cytochrome C n=1 Tax=Rubripirellula amarantea TaxID=2527999 RepID=A0A5C5WVD5_9BACT|nr:DUF1592 domain-containing protein [Rubripirellula amarantea]TWT54616.1 hypothetical protein Pla22_22660 [Rubripirellula amarantea]
MIRLFDLSRMLIVGAISLLTSVTRADENAYRDVVHPQLMEFCGDCHSPDDEDDAVGFLRDQSSDEVARNRGLWSSVAEQLHNRTMPPADSPQPSEAQRLELFQWIESHLRTTACIDGEFAGSPVPRRLNRDQYTHAIIDITGLDFDFTESFPADGSGGEGFDNNGETLFLPPLLMERYLEVAGEILNRVIVTPPFDQTYSLARGQSDNDHALLVRGSDKIDYSLRLSDGHSAERTVTLYRGGDYEFSLKANCDLESSLVLHAEIDGVEVFTEKLKPDQKNDSFWTPLRLTRGVHQIRIIVRDSNPNGNDNDVKASSSDDAPKAQLHWVHLNEPRRRKRDADDLANRQKATERLLAPAGDLIGTQEREAAREIIRHFGRLAFRRTLKVEELEQYLALFDRAIERDEPFLDSVKLPLKAILVSPHFLFLTEPTNEEPGLHRISDLELASRLSMFLWHSVPDATLIDLAEQDKLHEQNVLQEQVQRMLADPRSKRMASAFAGQWLGTNVVGKSHIPDTDFFKPDYTTELVTDLRDQVGELMHVLLRENRPVTELISSDYVVVNHRLAQHYKLNDVPSEDDGFARVSIDDSKLDSVRPGVLGLGAVHMLTSYARRTSPVLRGGWVLETIFGVHLPSPPPDAGALPGGDKERDKQSVRQRLEAHRANPACAACHDLIDPIGFAMENFDVLGRWRDKEGKFDIDAIGKLPSGEVFNGPMELREVLSHRQDEFLRTICTRMLGFALGRSLEDADSCTISALTDQLAQNENRIEALVMGIVTSVPFQYRQTMPIYLPTE